MKSWMQLCFRITDFIQVTRKDQYEFIYTRVHVRIVI